TTQIRQDPTTGRLAGIVAHRILERWDFAQDPSGLLAQITSAVQTTLGPEDQPHAVGVTESLNDLLATFGRSEIYTRLRSATILGREVPFLMPWGDHQIMEGVIDLLYRLGDAVWIADYKTDMVTSELAADRAEQYRTQGEVYKAAVKRSLGVQEVRFHCLFLRCATAVEL
ncbi:MAG: PD-(D/E)XK nuclease family protein, partial [Nitrospirae bacterium]|nr:PD-(D/E)XK nuclease family protein [Nitrospirota bacterium]